MTAVAAVILLGAVGFAAWKLYRLSADMLAFGITGVLGADQPDAEESGKLREEREPSA